MKTHLAIIALCCGSVLGAPGDGRHQVELESTYLGDGWFEYRLRTVADPAFLFFGLPGFSISYFPGYWELAPDPWDWQGTTAIISNRQYVAWNFAICTNTPCQPAPYERVFRARSQHLSFRQKANGALFTMTFAFIGGYHNELTSGNIVGFANVNALVPCAPDEGDNSPTNVLTRFSVGLPDVAITELVRSGNDIMGIRFNYTERSTLLLQASGDFTNWNSVAFIHGNPGVTTWTSGMPLNEYGSFFRLYMVAEGHLMQTNDLPAAQMQIVGEAPSALADALTADARVLKCRPSGGGVAVEVKTTPGSRYVVKLLRVGGETLQERVIDGSDAVATVVFHGPAPNPVLAGIARE